MKIQHIFAALSALVITMAGCSSGGQTGAWGAFKNGGGSGDVPVSETSKQLTYFAISPTGSGFIAGTIDETTHTVTFPVALPPTIYYIQYSSTGKYTQLAGAVSPLVSGVSTVDFTAGTSVNLIVYAVDGTSQYYTVTVTTTGTTTGGLTSLTLTAGSVFPVELWSSVSTYTGAHPTVSVGKENMSATVGWVKANSSDTVTVKCGILGGTFASYDMALSTTCLITLAAGITEVDVIVNPASANPVSYIFYVDNTGTSGSITGLYLQYLTGNSITLDPAFSSAIYGYSASVASDVANINVVLTTPTIAMCSMTVNGGTAQAFSNSTSAATAALVAGNNSIVVTCGSAAYTINVTRGTATVPVIKDFTLLSALNSAEMLTTDCFGSIDESTEPGTIDVWVPVGTMLGALIPTFSVSAGYVTDGATTQQSGITSRNFYSGEVLYIVTDGSVTRSYNVLVTDVGLDALNVDGYTVGSFSEAKRAYTASVPNGTTSMTVGWTKKVMSDVVSVINNSTMTPFYDQNPALSTSSVVVTLSNGYSTDKITVPVERSGSPTKTYSITVTRY